MGIDEKMRERGMLRLEIMFDIIERSILRDRYRFCDMRRDHEWHNYRNKEICYFCWRDSSTIDEEPTSEDMRRGLMKAREILSIGLRPLTL